MAFTIYPNALILGCYEHLNAAFPEQEFVWAELDAVLTALYNSIRWSVLRRAETETDQRAVTELPTTNGFASKWMKRSEILQRICDTSGLDLHMSETCLVSIERAFQLASTESSEVAMPPVGLLRKHRRGYLIELSEAFQLTPARASLRVATATSAI